MKKRLLYLAALCLLLLVAYISKPDDKKCIIESVHAVWGRHVPDQKLSRYYDAFMNATSRSVVIDDWVLLKRIGYQFRGGTKTVGIGAFNHVFIL